VVLDQILVDRRRIAPLRELAFDEVPKGRGAAAGRRRVGGHFWYTLPLGRYRVGGHFNRGGTLCRQQLGFASNAPDRGAMMAALTGDAPFAPSQTQ
jgi:hypothetical protein